MVFFVTNNLERCPWQPQGTCLCLADSAAWPSWWTPATAGAAASTTATSQFLSWLSPHLLPPPPSSTAIVPPPLSFLPQAFSWQSFCEVFLHLQAYLSGNHWLCSVCVHIISDESDLLRTKPALCSMRILFLRRLFVTSTSSAKHSAFFKITVSCYFINFAEQKCFAVCWKALQECSPITSKTRIKEKLSQSNCFCYFRLKYFLSCQIVKFLIPLTNKQRGCSSVWKFWSKDFFFLPDAVR